jgi:hypothetical protein
MERNLKIKKAFIENNSELINNRILVSWLGIKIKTFY